VYKLVQWTKRLPFYLELPVEVHTRLLTHKWHELLVLTTSAYQAMHGQHRLTNAGTDGTGADFMQEVIIFLKIYIHIHVIIFSYKDFYVVTRHIVIYSFSGTDDNFIILYA